LLGLEYESCCYALRLVAGQEKNYINENKAYRFMLQMNFKGLSSVGNMSKQNVEQHIAGFESTF